MPGVRYVGGGDITDFFRASLDGLRREQEYLAQRGHRGPLPPAAYLAISGGGDNGAFAAGLLNGWTAAGTRPAPGRHGERRQSAPTLLRV